MRMVDVIPEDIQNELLGLRDELSRCIWRIGDITNMLMTACDESDFGRMVIYSSVALLVGKASRTVREYAQIARRYCQSERERYDVLSFDHFRLANRLGDANNEMLEWAIGDGADAYNRPATVDAMVAKFANDKDIEDGYLFDIKHKSDAFLACLSPLLNTSLGDRAREVKEVVMDFVEDCHIELEKVV